MYIAFAGYGDKKLLILPVPTPWVMKKNDKKGL